MTEKQKDMKMADKANESHCVCHNYSSLEELSFHAHVKGCLITLSEGGRRATRDSSSFRNGLVFSGRPVKIREKVRLLVVEHSMCEWHGSVRVGFANCLPEQTPLPTMAIPDLTKYPQYTATIVPEDICCAGSEFEFWLDRDARLCIRSSDGTTYMKRTTLNIHRPIWAIVDVYGKTSAVLLLGSKKKGLFWTYRSCPALTHIKHTKDNGGYKDISKEMLDRTKNQMSNLYHENTDSDSEDCVVCYSEVSKTLLGCGHKCVCAVCAVKIYEMFGTCPLCRQRISSIKVH
ncbi:E3 ubiquitin-protein ligase NEURL3-like [Myxocyprinus asiaticus]|uniref:E3 ubiquitin-protein ligase NEURL3-like n=1 Tax=Myxocyprinus asiaticus TaxID=70543 RepID=UPI0022221FF2|nr:E3 ubiquitin-protein ligase NEURL3-like [Myxocyprinus asiaticus]XP_051509135.1 E3 ubiquitin-protein ligase NEURL3-like [Myxocyprinus asiaticus]XP_051509136.1 E3 ubiquitin-protein ligase NEURL3-like [Myxocyprinus asiaticus]